MGRIKICVTELEPNMLLKTKLKSSDKLSALQMLALCPALAVTTTLSRSLAISGALLVSLTLSAVLVSVLRKRISVKLRVPVYLLLSSFSVTMVYLIMRAVFPASVMALGIYLPVLAVSCVMIMRLETFSACNTPGPAALDGLITGAEFSVIMLGCGFIRELLGTGRLFADPFGQGGLKIFPAAPVSFLAQPAGALLLIGAGMAVFQYIQIRSEKKAAVELETV